MRFRTASSGIRISSAATRPGRRQSAQGSGSRRPAACPRAARESGPAGRREDVDDAVDRLRRALGVQGREHEVAGLGGGQRGRDRLEVAHLAHEDHVGVLAKRGAERIARTTSRRPELALVDDARAVPMEELDRILDREDVLVPRLVDVVEQRGERRRLARAGRAGDEHEAARVVGEFVELRRHVELFEAADVGRDQPEGGRDALALEEHVDAEAREPGTECEKSSWRLVSKFFCCSVEMIRYSSVRISSGSSFSGPGEPLELAVDADDGRRPAVR